MGKRSQQRSHTIKQKITPSPSSREIAVTQNSKKVSVANSSNKSEVKSKIDWNQLNAYSSILATLCAVGAGLVALLAYSSSVDSSQKQLRSYVGLERVEFDFQTKDDPNYQPKPFVAGSIENDFVKVTVKNFGSTPAQDVKIWTNWDSFSYPNQPPDNYQFVDIQSKTPSGLDLISSQTVVNSGQTYVSHVAVHDLKPFFAANQKKTLLYLFGHIDYRDIYGINHQTKFCYSYQPFKKDADAFVPYSRNNEAD